MYNPDFTYITEKRRVEIYEEVWSEPLVTVAKRYEISDTTLRNHCKKLDIPLPPRGYWTRTEDRQKAGKTRLTKVTKEISKYVREYLIKYREDEHERTDEDILSDTELNMLTDVTIQYIKETCSKIKVPSQLRNACKEITDHKEEMVYRKKRDKTLKPLKGTVYYNNFKSKFRDNNPVIPINVSLKNINRTYRIIDTIIKVLPDFEGGFQVNSNVSTWPKQTEDTASIYLIRTHYSISINETLNSNEKSILVLIIGKESNLEFTDLPDKPLEEQLGDIIYKIAVEANKRYASEIIRHRIEERKWEEQIRILEEQRRQKSLEEIRKNRLEEIELLLVSANDWEKADHLRKFLNALEVKLEFIDGEENKEKIKKWIKSQRDKADWLDPLLYVVDKQLGESPYIIQEILNNKDL